MKKIVKVVLFIAGLCVILSLASNIFVPKNNMASFGMEEVEANGILGEKEHTVDVLILGDSESFTSFIPMQLWKDAGYTSYISGSIGQTLNYTEVLLKRAFQNQSPKIVFLETSAIYRTQTLDQAVFARLYELFPVLRYHNRWKSLSWNDVNKEPDYTWTSDSKGFKYSVLVQPSLHTEYMTPTDEVEPISEINTWHVQEMKKLCDANGARLILLSTPSTVNWNYKRHNGVTQLAKSIGCEYIDLNVMQEEVTIDWNTDTRDKGDHLNYYGAKKVTTYLTSYLSSLQLLENHQNDVAYQQWNDSLIRFEQAISTP